MLPVFKEDTLNSIETRIATIIRSDGKSWKLSYELIKKVEKERLWERAGHRSFTEWVRYMANQYSISEISIWKILGSRSQKGGIRHCKEHNSTIYRS